MARKVQQFRYYGDSNKNNYPIGLNAEALRSGIIFKQFASIKNIGILTINSPITFYVNELFERGNTINAGESIVVNGENALISSLVFDRKSFTQNSEIVIDVIYEDD